MLEVFDMLDEFVFIADEQLRPKRCVNHRNSRKVLETSAAECCDLLIFGTLDQRTGDDMAELTCEPNFIIMNVTSR